MTLSESDIDFLQKNQSAAMITVAPNGVAKPARVALVMVDGKLWSSGTLERVRTRRLRRDPRCTLFVFDNTFAWLGLETTVTLLEGPDAAYFNLRLFRAMQSKPTGPLTWFGAELTEPDFLQRMVDERRLIYEFNVERAYGLH
jgi:hypothetical protein